MIKLSGFEPYTEIDIQEIGLRPGEKLYEELLLDQEVMQESANKHIYIAQKNILNSNQVAIIQNLLSRFINEDNLDHYEVIKLLKDLVPEFKSQNSIYSTLDV